MTANNLRVGPAGCYDFVGQFIILSLADIFKKFHLHGDPALYPCEGHNEHLEMQWFSTCVYVCSGLENLF